MNFGDEASVNFLFRKVFAILLLVNISRTALPVVEVEGQPLGANVARMIQGLDFLGASLPAAEVQQLKAAIEKRDAAAIQKIIAPHVLAGVSLNPEVRVKLQRWPVYSRAALGILRQQALR